MPGQIDEDDKDFCAAAADSLPDVITDNTWGEWTGALKAEHGRKGKSLFMPLRKALSGRDRGPQMGEFLVLLGAEKAKARLRGEVG